MPPVPTHPEPLASLQARYPAALEQVFDVVAIRDRGATRPGEIAANVFDFEDGLKLLVSKERMPDGELVLHVSASFASECRIADELRLLAISVPRKRIMAMWRESIPKRFAELSGDTRPLVYAGTSEQGVPHFHIALEPAPATANSI